MPKPVVQLPAAVPSFVPPLSQPVASGAVQGGETGGSTAGSGHVFRAAPLPARSVRSGARGETGGSTAGGGPVFRAAPLSARSVRSSAEGWGTKAGGSTAGGGPVCEADPDFAIQDVRERVLLLNSPALRHPVLRQADPRHSNLLLRLRYSLRWCLP